MKHLLSIGLYLSVAFSASAQDECSSYVGQIVKPKSFDVIVSGFARLRPKGEFETTSEYEARKARIMGEPSGPVILAKPIEEREFIQYDADSRQLRIISYAFHNKPFDTWSAFYSAGLQDQLNVDIDANVEAVISSHGVPTGTYAATNGYGARFTVLKVHRTTKAVFESKELPGQSSLFPSAEESPYAIGSIELKPEEARRLKTTVKLAFVLTPKDPYLVKGTHKTGKTTLQNPQDITEDFSVLVADLQCGLVTDAGNRVLLAVPTR